MKVTKTPEEKFLEIKELFTRMSHEMSFVVECYYIWRTLTFARSIAEVGQEIADKNAKLMTTHKDFFVPTEQSHLNTFIIGLMKFFDKDSRALSIANLINEIDKNKSFFTPKLLRTLYPNLVPFQKIKNSYKPIYKYTINDIQKIEKKHLKLITNLKNIRNKQFAHTDMEVNNGNFVPNEIEILIKDTQEIFNKLSSNFDFSVTAWDYLKQDSIKNTEFLLENLEIGESKRRKDIQKKYGLDS